MKITIDKYNEGVRKDNTGHYVFDRHFDFDSDVLKLTTNTSGKNTVDNLTYYYGYEFNDNVDIVEQSAFRRALKHDMHDPNIFYSDDVDNFVEDGIYRMNSMKKLNDFSLVISTASKYGEQSLTGAMCVAIWDYVKPNVETLDQYNLQLFKKRCKDVTFDEERAREALLQTDKYGNNLKKLEDAISSLKIQFERTKKSNGLFTMKVYKPVIGRAGFIDFLKFKDEHDQNVYRNLREGKEVLICDDFLTSGSTVKEIIRFLNTINPNVNISVFVLVNQLRNY